MNFDYLAPRIRQILSAPDTDWSTVSAKHVRRQLLELEPNLTLEYIKENKKEIDAVISNVFETMHNSILEYEADPELNGNGKRKRQHVIGGEVVDQGQNVDGEDERDLEEASPSPATRAPKKWKGKASGLTDEEYARQLSSELNQRPARAGRKANGSTKKSSAAASKSPKKVKKSREQIEDDSEEDATADDDNQGGSRKGKKGKSTKKSGGGGAKGGFAKEFTLSEPLAAVLEIPQLSRPQVVKRLWQYIRQHDLQNPRNKKEIICDDALRAVFNSDKIDMFGMNKTLGQHLYELES